MLKMRRSGTRWWWWREASLSRAGEVAKRRCGDDGVVRAICELVLSDALREKVKRVVLAIHRGIAACSLSGHDCLRDAIRRRRHRHCRSRRTERSRNRLRLVERDIGRRRWWHRGRHLARHRPREGRLEVIRSISMCPLRSSSSYWRLRCRRRRIRSHRRRQIGRAMRQRRKEGSGAGRIGSPGILCRLGREASAHACRIEQVGLIRRRREHGRRKRSGPQRSIEAPAELSDAGPMRW